MSGHKRCKKFDTKAINKQLSLFKVTIKFNRFSLQVRSQQSSHASHIIQELRRSRLFLVRWLFPYSAAQIYPNYAYAYYARVFCLYAYVYTRIRVCQYARICPFVMHSHKFLYMKHCWSNKGHMGMKRLQSEICILLKHHADQ